MNDVQKFVRATHFAARAHANQRRKGAAQEPYFNHLIEVSEMVSDAVEGADLDLIIAALLHDTVEDTHVTESDLRALFGARVASLVLECSDDMTITKEERKRQRIEHAASRSNDAKMIKTADLISNLEGMAKSPPAGWSIEHRLGYLQGSKQLHAAMRGVSALLDMKFDETAAMASNICTAQAKKLIDEPIAVPESYSIDPTAGQPVHLIYFANTESQPITEEDREKLARIAAKSFPSVTMADAEAVFEGARRPIIMLRIRTDSTDSIVALAQRLCVEFNQRFAGVETERRYIRVYADDTGG